MDFIVLWVLGCMVAGAGFFLLPAPWNLIVLFGLALGSAWAALVRVAEVKHEMGGNESDSPAPVSGNAPWVQGERRLMARMAARSQEKSDEQGRR